MGQVSAAPQLGSVVEDKSSKALIRASRSNEVFLGVVGPVGAGSSRVMTSLKRAAQNAGYTCEVIKASDCIRAWATQNLKTLPIAASKTLDTVSAMQDLGDAMREADPAAVARAMIQEIPRRRAALMSVPYIEGKAVTPDDKKRAFLIDSIRHPAEIQLLRRMYANAFALVGVVCQPDAREKRVLGKYFSVPEARKQTNIAKTKLFIDRDANDSDKSYGQHVTDAFFMSDFFVDNTPSDEDDSKHLLDQYMGRLIDIISHEQVVRPTIEETAMHHAHSAQVRSACMSRQVGAALTDSDGTVISTGVNEVPRAGGGVYGEHFDNEISAPEHRCVFRESPFCSSNREQNRIIDELIGEIPELGGIIDQKLLKAKIRGTRLGQLIEFSRAVHAEMDALLSAGREGASTVGTRLFVTTFPCHYCARHIVSAGVYEVQYIEPYPKSLALSLHDDAIESNPGSWTPPEQISIAEGKRRAATQLRPGAAGASGYAQGAQSQAPGKVLFKPFVGVAPRLYTRAFEKLWKLKDKESGEFRMQPPEWGDEWAPFTLGYPELEAKLA